MAFMNKMGNVLKQTVSKHAMMNSNIQAVRRMSSSSSKIYVGGLSYSMDNDSLKEAFSRYGEVVEARVCLELETGRSRGYGFVTFSSTKAASSAIRDLDGEELHGRAGQPIRVNYATEV